jgi:NAD(P)-dependent dehydrogenase (short-subunit alcohol dehydrogenase family)
MKTTAQNPVVLITGALAGIGRATAIAFGRAGARVVVSGRRQEQGFALEAELRFQSTAARPLFNPEFLNQ